MYEELVFVLFRFLVFYVKGKIFVRVVFFFTSTQRFLPLQFCLRSSNSFYTFDGPNKKSMFIKLKVSIRKLSDVLKCDLIECY